MTTKNEMEKEFNIVLTGFELSLISASMFVLKSNLVKKAENLAESGKSPEDFSKMLKSAGIPDIIPVGLLSDRDVVICEKFMSAVSAGERIEDLREYQ